MKTNQMIVTPSNSNTSINTNQNILDNVIVTSTLKPKKPKVKVVAKSVEVTFTKRETSKIVTLLDKKSKKGKELFDIEIELAKKFSKNEKASIWDDVKLNKDNPLTDQDKYEYRFTMKNYNDVMEIANSKDNKLWNLGAIRKHIQKQRKTSEPTIVEDDVVENDEPIANADISFSFSQFVINFFATIKKYDVSKDLLISFRDELTKYIDSIK